MRIILRISCTDTTCKMCRFGEISRIQKATEISSDSKHKKCYFGVICFNYEKVAFGSSKSKNFSQIDTFRYIFSMETIMNYI